jgi:hypothetical protein
MTFVSEPALKYAITVKYPNSIQHSGRYFKQKILKLTKLTLFQARICLYFTVIAYLRAGSETKVIIKGVIYFKAK